MDQLKILRNFWKDKYVGAVVPTSPFCVKKVCEKIDFTQDNAIVEYGPGTGVFSEYMLERLTPASRLILIETNDDLIHTLQDKFRNDKRVKVIHDSAENIKAILEKLQIKEVHYVISGIPFTFIPKRQKSRLLLETRGILKEDGKFLVYQYNRNIRHYLKHYFDRVDMTFALLNIPPLTIYEASVKTNRARNGV